MRLSSDKRVKNSGQYAAETTYSFKIWIQKLIKTNFFLLFSRLELVMAKKDNKNSGSNQFFENPIMRIDAVAKMLGYSESHVYRLVNQEKIPFRKRGGTLFFMRQEIIDWVNEGV